MTSGDVEWYEHGLAVKVFEQGTNSNKLVL